MNTLNAVDAALIAGATARITRLITVDDVPGRWWIKDPLEIAAVRYAHRHEREPGWSRYLEGLDCAWCCSVHVATWVTVSHALWGDRRWWRVAATALTASAVVVPLGRQVDFWD